jgi:large subunit ribosomal protein L6
MSRIGRLPVTVPSGVDVTIDGQAVTVKGPKGSLSLTVPEPITVDRGDEGNEANTIEVKRPNDEREARSLHGLTRSLINNMVVGVTDGYRKGLEITGVGYRAALQGKNLQLALGYSHDVVYAIPEGIAITVPKPTEIIIAGNDSQRVGQVAAEIRSYRPPEPYKGKGVKYSNEFIFRKEGKKK